MRMSESNQSYDRLRAGLNRLFEKAGYVDAELEQFLEEAIRMKQAAKTDLPKRKPSSTQADIMSSRLRDALRE